jgi:hypothetical protein
MEETLGPLQNLIQLSFRHIHPTRYSRQKAQASSPIELIEDSPMAIFQQNLPASLRFGPPAAPENRGIPATDRRPYLVTVPPRKPVTSARRGVATTSQYLALFPHESEDARLTGATRSLYRRLLALNLPRPSVRSEVSVERRDVTEVRFKTIDTRIA